MFVLALPCLNRHSLHHLTLGPLRPKIRLAMAHLASAATSFLDALPLGIGAGVRHLDMASVKVYDSSSWTWPQAVVLYLVAMFFAERIQDLPDLLL